MSSNLKVLQVIPKLGYGGAETGCYDIAHYLPENGCKSFIVTSGGELLKFVDKNKVKVFRLPVQSKNPILILINAIILTFIILFNNISIIHARSRAPALWKPSPRQAPARARVPAAADGCQRAPRRRRACVASAPAPIPGRRCLG